MERARHKSAGHPLFRTFEALLPPHSTWHAWWFRVLVHNGTLHGYGDAHTSVPIPDDDERLDIVIGSDNEGRAHIWPSVETAKHGVVSTAEDMARAETAADMFGGRVIHGTAARILGMTDENVVKCFFYFVELGLEMFPKEGQ